MSEFRWHLFVANLDPIIGSEQGKTRPVLVISEEAMNSLLPVVDVLPLTSRKPGRKIYPNEVLLRPEVSGLNLESIVLSYQIRALDKRRLMRRVGTIQEEDTRIEILEALSFQLGLRG